MFVALCVYDESMTASMNDPEFLRFIFNNMPRHMLNEAFDDYLQTNGLTESFESWFMRLPFNADLMNLIHMVYEFDQQGKRDNEELLISLAVTKKTPKQFNRKPPITTEEINAFSDFMASGGLDALLDNKKKNQ